MIVWKCQKHKSKIQWIFFAVKLKLILTCKLNRSIQDYQLVMTEKKLVEAFRTFFDKSVAPYVTQNEEIMREWNHLSKIINADPIDYSQIQFYLLLANKGNNINSKGSQHNINSSNKIPEDSSKFRFNDFNSVMEKAPFQKKGSQIGSNSNKKKNLVSNLQSFQRLLTQNQEKLQNMNKKETTQGFNTSANGIALRRY